MIGTKLAHYEITGHLGTGGMGEVYQATDSKLARSVAIKLLPEAFARDVDRLARFEREARFLASLNHPHIAAIYGLEESNGRKFLVMELASGETLAARISRGPIPLDEALKISGQIAEALEAAHEKGVIHRDLKPANIKVTTDGHVKVLDFGLAKAFAGEAGNANLSNSPTISMEATQAGVILGTAAYMSPEQAKGRPVDKRTDIFTFGAVLYEMLTGLRLHEGESVSEVLASVLKEAPDLNGVPARVRPLLRSCLQKDPTRRLHDIADAKLLLELSGDGMEVSQNAKGSPAWVWPAVAAILLLIAVGLGIIYFRRTPLVNQKVTSEITKPDGLTFNSGTTATISPNGLWLAFPALGPDKVSRMYLRNVASKEVKPLPGSEQSLDLAPPPFWTYDSQFVVYGAKGRLMKSEVKGTPAQIIADTDQPFVQGGTENRDGVILYANRSGILMQVPESGGTPVAVTVLDSDSGEIAHRWPQFLPDGRRFLYLRVFPNSKKTGIYVGSLDVKAEEQKNQLLLPTNRQAYWVTSETDGRSYLLEQQEATLLAQSFDPATTKLSGNAVQVENEVGSFANATAGLWSVARTGTLMYRSGGSAPSQLTWRDPDGTIRGVLGEPNFYDTPALSPDDTKVAFQIEDAQGNYDIYVRNIMGGGIDINLTSDPGYDTSPVFSPDSKMIVFGANRGGHRDLYVKNANGSGSETLLWSSNQDKTPTSWSKDGFLLFTSSDPKTADDLWVLPINSPQKACPLLNSKGRETDGQFSKDGSLIAYVSNQYVSFQIFVRPFSANSPCPANPSTGSPWQISKTYSYYPYWSSNRKRLFFESQNGVMLATDVLPGPSFGSPHTIFTDVDTNFHYAASSVNERFLFVQPPVLSGPPPPFNLVQNWLDGLK